MEDKKMEDKNNLIGLKKTLQVAKYVPTKEYLRVGE